MEELLKLIVQSIVQKPKAVKITQKKEEGSVNLQLEVDPEDMKIIIGKGGRTIRAIRNLLRVLAVQEGVRVNLEIKED